MTRWVTTCAGATTRGVRKEAAGRSGEGKAKPAPPSEAGIKNYPDGTMKHVCRAKPSNTQQAPRLAEIRRDGDSRSRGVVATWDECRPSAVGLAGNSGIPQRDRGSPSGQSRPKPRQIRGGREARECKPEL